jgi:pseudouridine synthase
VPDERDSNARTEKLARFLARCGVASRRRCEEFIRAGWVRVDGIEVTDPAVRTNFETRKVTLRGKRLEPPKKLRYIVLNKPKGVVCTRKPSREKSRTIFDIVELPERLFNVGRLDKDTTGLLLLTNDGDLAQRLMHPSYEKEKEYIVTTTSPLSKTHLSRLRRGVQLDDGLSKFQSVEQLNRDQVKVVLTEGRKRQIRRTFKKIGLRIRHLHRIRVGNLTLGTLPEGQWRDLTDREIQDLKRTSKK